METTMTAAAEMTTTHPFEVAGLGKAPFRLVRSYECVHVAYPGATPVAGGTCDYCGTGIRNVFEIAGADGRTFKVGCECVNKTCNKFERVSREVLAAKRAAARKARAAKAERTECTLETMLADDSVRTRLSGLPHPRGFAGMTMLDYAEWMMANAGAAGRAKLLKAIR